MDPIRVIPKPGFLASGAEKAYYAGLLAYLAGNYADALSGFEKVLAADPSATSARLFASVSAKALDDAQRAVQHLETVISSSAGMPDRYQAKYMPESVFTLALGVRITDSVTAKPPFGNFAAALTLAEVYQSSGKLEEAIGLMQQVYETLPDPLVRLSLCDLLFADGDYEAVIETSSGVANGSDVDVETLRLRGAALLAGGHPSTALEALTQGLAKTANRDRNLLNAVRYDRAIVLDQLGQAKRSRQDLERIYASDPSFVDVRERLAAT